MIHKTLSFSNLINFEILLDTKPYFIFYLDLILFDRIEFNMNVEYEFYTYIQRFRRFKNIKRFLEGIFSMKLDKVNTALILNIYILSFIYFSILLDTDRNKRV